MTTYERLRQRQLVQGVLIIVIGLMILGQTWYINQKSGDTRRCLAENFAELSSTLNARAVQNEKATKAQARVWDTYGEAAGLLKDDPTAPLKPADQERLQRELVAALVNYSEVVKEVEAARKKKDAPPYPEGDCS